MVVQLIPSIFFQWFRSRMSPKSLMCSQMEIVGGDWDMRCYTHHWSDPHLSSATWLPRSESFSSPILFHHTISTSELDGIVPNFTTCGSDQTSPLNCEYWVFCPSEFWTVVSVLSPLATDPWFTVSSTGRSENHQIFLFLNVK